MHFILARLIDFTWYWFVGYRYGDADGVGKLKYLARCFASRVEQRRKAVRMLTVPSSSSSQE